MDAYLSMVVSAFSSCLDWFGDILFGSGMPGLYLGCIAVYMTYRFILAPVFGAITNAGASDVATRRRENKRYHGKFERNQKGKYSR